MSCRQPKPASLWHPRVAVAIHISLPGRGIDFAVGADWGHVRQRHDGRWYLDFGRAGRLYSARGTRFGSEADARAALAIVRGLRAQGATPEQAVEAWLPAASPAHRVERWMPVWLDRMRALEAAGEVGRGYVEELERWGGRKSPSAAHFRPLDKRSVHSLTAGEIEAWGNGLPVSPKTRLNVMAGFHAFLVWLHRSEIIVRVPPFRWPKVQEHVPTILSPETQERVLAAIPEARRGIFLALALLGLRPSEAMRLDAADVVDGWISVRRTKNRQAKRVPVPEALAAWIASHVPADARLRGEPLFRMPYTGRGRRGEGRWCATSLRRDWRAACAAVGVRAKLYEGTKHSGATALLALGVPERTLQALLGHRDARSTRRYARLGDVALVEALGRRR